MAVNFTVKVVHGGVAGLAAKAPGTLRRASVLAGCWLAAAWLLLCALGLLLGENREGRVGISIGIV